MSETTKPEGRWLAGQDGERRWYAYPERDRCGGHGWMRCRCGGDLCVCANGGEIECDGCPECEPEDFEEAPGHG